jgi:hypothetical protein
MLRTATCGHSGIDELASLTTLHVLNSTDRDKYLRLLLRAGGCLLVSAFPTMLLPVDWMAASHEWLGMGAFPRRPVVDYLARSAAVLYGFHGILLFVVARDLARYRPLIGYLVFTNVTFGLMLVAVDLHAGLPAWWTLVEGPSVLMIGVLMYVLNSPRASP